MKTTLSVTGMSCVSCSSHVDRAVRQVPGVQSATVDLRARTVDVTHAHPIAPSLLTDAIMAAGYGVAIRS